MELPPAPAVPVQRQRPRHRASRSSEGAIAGTGLAHGPGAAARQRANAVQQVRIRAQARPRRTGPVSAVPVQEQELGPLAGHYLHHAGPSAVLAYGPRRAPVPLTMTRPRPRRSRRASIRSRRDVGECDRPAPYARFMAGRPRVSAAAAATVARRVVQRLIRPLSEVRAASVAEETAA